MPVCWLSWKSKLSSLRLSNPKMSEVSSGFLFLSWPCGFSGCSYFGLKKLPGRDWQSSLEYRAQRRLEWVKHVMCMAWMTSFWRYTHPKTKIALQKWWLEDYLPFQMVLFRWHVNFRGCNLFELCQNLFLHITTACEPGCECERIRSNAAPYHQDKA